MRTSWPRRLAVVILGLAALDGGLARSAAAQELPPPAPPRPHGHFEVDARLGVALPIGDFARAVGMSDNVAAQVPLGVGAGFRWPGGTYLGAFFSYGVLAMKHGSPACPDGWTHCGGHDVRFGGELLFHLRSRRSVDPWFGFGAGYEWLSYHASLAQAAGDLRDDVTLEGGELLNVQLGVDFTVEGAFTLGPFVTLTFASFGEVTAERSGAVTNTPTSQSLSSAWHEWLFLGARGSFSLL